MLLTEQTFRPHIHHPQIAPLFHILCWPFFIIGVSSADENERFVILLREKWSVTVKSHDNPGPEFDLMKLEGMNISSHYHKGNHAISMLFHGTVIGTERKGMLLLRSSPIERPSRPYQLSRIANER